MTSIDSVRLDSPAGRDALKWLEAIQAGAIRKSVFLPSLPDMEWVLMGRSAEEWIFSGRFCGEPVMHVVITVNNSLLQLKVL